MTEAVLQVFQENVQALPGDCESGGILLGCVRGQHLEVIQATVPTKWDKRFRHLFERMSLGHRELAEGRWRDSSGTVRYLGEWHTHPENDPNPSNLDQLEWRKLAEKRQDKRPMLAVIVGRRGLYVELVPARGVGRTLAPID